MPERNRFFICDVFPYTDFFLVNMVGMVALVAVVALVVWFFDNIFLIHGFLGCLVALAA